MVALIAIMSQIGSYVPATSVKLGMLDSVLTRMGGMFKAPYNSCSRLNLWSVAWDDLMQGRSTFMVEMSETSEILQTSTDKSLVVLDELGRGTSTFDGVRFSCFVRTVKRTTSCWLMNIDGHRSCGSAASGAVDAVQNSIYHTLPISSCWNWKAIPRQNSEPAHGLHCRRQNWWHERYHISIPSHQRTRFWCVSVISLTASPKQK